MKNHGEKELVLRCSTRTDRFHRQLAKDRQGRQGRFGSHRFTHD
jgi:hypothetical protein